MSAAQEKQRPPFTLALIAGGIAGTTVEVSAQAIPATFSSKYYLPAFLLSAPYASILLSTYETRRTQHGLNGITGKCFGDVVRTGDADDTFKRSRASI
eukprot:2977703-Amphidinium_carterae.1